MDEESKDLEARIAYLEENVIKDDIDNRGISIPVMSKKDYIATGIFALICFIFIIIGGLV